MGDYTKLIALMTGKCKC